MCSNVLIKEKFVRSAKDIACGKEGKDESRKFSKELYSIAEMIVNSLV